MNNIQKREYSLEYKFVGQSRSDAELHRVIGMVVRLCTNGAWAIGSNRPPQGIAIVEGFINYFWHVADWQLERGYTVERSRLS